MVKNFQITLFFFNNKSGDNKIIAGKCGAINVILSTMKIHIDNADVCKEGCDALCNISSGDFSFLKEIYGKGGLTILLEVLKKHNDDNNNTYLIELCCTVIVMIFSSQKVYSKIFTQDVLSAVRECYKKHKDSERIRHCFFCLAREEDPRVKDAVSRGVCTKDAFPRCRDDCKCDEGYYCPKCCVQQKMFRCHTCDKSKNMSRFYCEACRRKHHQGHECKEFFYLVRCETK